MTGSPAGPSIGTMSRGTSAARSGTATFRPLTRIVAAFIVAAHPRWPRDRHPGPIVADRPLIEGGAGDGAMGRIGDDAAVETIHGSRTLSGIPARVPRHRGKLRIPDSPSWSWSRPAPRDSASW